MLRLDQAFSRRRSGSRLGRRGTLLSRRFAVERLEDRRLMSSDLIGSSFPISPAPAKGVSFTGVVAKITDADKNTDPGQYAASIHWGDGKVSRGTITADPGGGFDVIGSTPSRTTGRSASRRRSATPTATSSRSRRRTSWPRHP